MFGSSPSFAAIAASKVFKRENVNNILELGGGQGRDSLFFARKGFRIDVLDCLLYSSPSPRDATLSRMPSTA